MGEASSGLMKLRPVTFHYKPECANGPRIRQYGLIAEEVAEVYPNLVSYNSETGQPETVFYQHVNAMVLNEVQKQHKEITALKEQIEELSTLKEEVSALKEQNKELSALKEQIKELSAMVGQSRNSSARLSMLEAQRKE